MILSEYYLHILQILNALLLGALLCRWYMNSKIVIHQAALAKMVDALKIASEVIERHGTILSGHQDILENLIKKDKE